MRAFKTLLISVAALTASQGAMAQNIVGTGIAATVNDTPISTFDVQQRVRLLLVTSGGRMPEGAERQFQEQALRDLIEEELKRQETASFEVNVSDAEVNQELARIAAGGGGTIESLTRDLAQAGIAIEKLRDKIRVDNAWQTLVRGRFGSRVSITEGEVDTMLDDMRAETQAEQYLLSEICLPVESEEQKDRIYSIGMQMLGQMQQGVPFQALAQQFSVCPSAARGGDLGWMRAPQLAEPVAEVVEQLANGNVSTPIEVEDGEMIKLVAMRQKRAAAEKGDPSYELAYAAVPKSEYPREEAEERLGQLPVTNACNADGLSTDLGKGIGVELLPMIPIAQIRPDFQDQVLGLRRGDTSEMMESGQYYHRVYVCEMDEGLGLPRRRMVESQLEADQFNLLARRYLRDVERDADVDIRLFEEAPAQDS
ncbi:peptidylprolyl isomerase [Parvularcula sp. ZS-1/3]|uniref:Parvulin-like PPIase n=1 Tax=Parvularcula mediterranea TaxID=2732508 RepID=A0A7Y3W5V5_9PROT|nr:peptidylprolyl isomerase [Parvularcula mediterranea]NNU16671.1 peptidylprolyl isomerase [Parvularcula mediterranea]